MEQYLIPAIASIVVVIIEAIAARDRKKAADRAEVRKRESRLSMDMMFATLKMCDCLCIALQGGKTNGNVEQARDAARKAKAEYQAFLMDETADKVAS